MNKNEQKAHKAVRRALKSGVSSLMHASIVITDHVSIIRARDIIEDEIDLLPAEIKHVFNDSLSVDLLDMITHKYKREV